MSTAHTHGTADQQPPIGNFDQPVLAIVDPHAFNAVRGSIAACFSGANVEKFLRSVERQGLRIRSFEAVLGKGLLGASTQAEYASLGNGDQGQIREFYLASLERVAAPLRASFFKLYSYY